MLAGTPTATAAKVAMATARKKCRPRLVRRFKTAISVRSSLIRAQRTRCKRERSVAAVPGTPPTRHQRRAAAVRGRLRAPARAALRSLDPAERIGLDAELRQYVLHRRTRCILGRRAGVNR